MSLQVALHQLRKIVHFNSPHPPIYEKGDLDKVKNSSITILLKKDNVFQ